MKHGHFRGYVREGVSSAEYELALEQAMVQVNEMTCKFEKATAELYDCREVQLARPIVSQTTSFRTCCRPLEHANVSVFA